MRFDAATVASVIEHMNADHSDACIVMVRAMSAHSDPTEVVMTNIDSHGMEFAVTHATGERENDPDSVRIEFPKPLREASQIRGMLVAMTRQARATLSNE